MIFEGTNQPPKYYVDSIERKIIDDSRIRRPEPPVPPQSLEKIEVKPDSILPKNQTVQTDLKTNTVDTQSEIKISPPKFSPKLPLNNPNVQPVTKSEYPEPQPILSSPNDEAAKKKRRKKRVAAIEDAAIQTPIVVKLDPN